MERTIEHGKLPLVSVGIPTYNRPVELERALQQMLGQTYKNIEIIIADNCSTMQEVELVAKSYVARFPNVKYYRNASNLGVLRNTAELVDHAGGEYFCWVSDDDYRSADFVERTVAYLQNAKDAVAVFCDFAEVDSEDGIYPGYPRNHAELMRFFSSGSRLFRRLMYYLSSAACGKCNALYSLFRTEELRGMNFHDLSDSYKALNMDCFIVYQTLALAPITILDFEGCRLTVGNKKNYQAASSGPNAFKKVFGLVSELNNDRRRYCRFSNRTEAIFITVLFPLKAIAEITRSALGIKCYSPFAKCTK